MTKEERRAYSRKWYHENKEKRKEYLLGQRARYAALRREWRKSNRMKDAAAAIKSKCNKTGTPYNITEDDLPVPEYCPVFPWIKLGWDGPREHVPSVDRVIPALGYVKGNVRVISLRANRIKSDANRDEIAAILAYLDQQKAPCVYP